VSILDRGQRLIGRTRGIERYLGQPVSPSLIAGLAKSGEGWYRGQTLEGQEVYAAFSRSQVTGRTVAIGIPAEALDGPLRRASAWMVVGIFVSTALALGLAILNAREIAEPVVGLTQGAEAVTRGEPPGQEPTAIVEVGQLARALDDAAMAIRERDREKERLLGEAQAARREAEGLNRAKDEFLAMLGHELRNPLGAISSAVYVLGHAGRGSIFTLGLPAVAAPVAERARERAPEPVQASRRVLIVEDNADSRDMLKALFTLEGHEVYEAVDGPSAIEAMAREHPDIAFIDIDLPGASTGTRSRAVYAPSLMEPMCFSWPSLATVWGRIGSVPGKQASMFIW
jgi:signal transduction histidine kinase